MAKTFNKESLAYEGARSNPEVDSLLENIHHKASKFRGVVLLRVRKR
jgi:hypothetical protein